MLLINLAPANYEAVTNILSLSRGVQVHHGGLLIHLYCPNKTAPGHIICLESILVYKIGLIFINPNKRKEKKRKNPVSFLLY